MRRSLFAVLFASFLLVIGVGVVPVLLAARARVPAMVAAVLVAVALAVAISVLLAGRFARPVRELSEALRRFRAGDMSVRVMLGRRGELSDLGERFNETAEHTRRIIGDLMHQQAALDAIIGSMSEGLVLLDRDGRVDLANRSFRQIVGTDDVVGRFHWELLREPEFAALVRQAGDEMTTVSGRVDLSGRVYAGNAIRIAASGRTVVTLYDITSMAQSERMKRELVLNASHEIRTPLTAIRGYLETMETAVSDANRGHLEVVRRHTERLSRLVQDLLTLSEMEEPDLKLELEPVEVNLLAADVAGLFAAAAHQKGIELRVEPCAESLSVRSDRFRLEQVLINLVDNAIRFTDQGTVTLRVIHRDDRVIIEVADTGCGIEEKHLPRIFERFYVVDKSRSRQSGGTGLGLAIVKHIVRLLGGEVAVDSRPGVGSRFTVSIPIAG